MRENKTFTRRDFLVRLGGSAAALSLGSFSIGKSAVPSGSKGPNVIIVFNDQLRTLALGCYDGGQNITTPHLDQMAQEGIRFRNAVTTCPLCSPFRGMLVTGRFPTHSGILINNLRPNMLQPTIAKVFRDAGYNTGFIGKWHLYHPKFDTYVPYGSRRLGFRHWEAYNFENVFMSTPYCRDDPTILHMDGYEMDFEIDRAIDFITTYKDSPAPFFLVVAPHPPHGPRNTENTPEGYVEEVADPLWWPPNCPDPGNQVNKAPYYYAMIKNADDNMGRLLQVLDTENLSEDTIVIYTSDHGDMLGSKGLTGKNYPYAESVNIPVIARWKGHIPTGVETDALHTPVDILTSLCGLVGLEAPSTADGVDLSPVYLGTGTVGRDAVLMANYSSSLASFATGTNKQEWRAVKTETHTYVKWLDGTEELYDDIADPFQMTDLIDDPSQSSVLSTLRSRLTELLAAAHDEFLPGSAYADWIDEDREIIWTGLGPVYPPVTSCGKSALGYR